MALETATVVQRYDFCLSPDRKKDLVKLQLGEYVSLGKVEAELKTCSVVENICVYGDATKHYTVALIVPNPSHLAALGNRLGFTSLNFEQLCVNQAVEKAVLHELQEHGKKCKFNFMLDFKQYGKLFCLNPL
jgi:long-chain acyl-CoA synthetase